MSELYIAGLALASFVEDPADSQRAGLVQQKGVGADAVYFAGRKISPVFCPVTAVADPDDIELISRGSKELGLEQNRASA